MLIKDQVNLNLLEVGLVESLESAGGQKAHAVLRRTAPHLIGE